MYIQDVFTKYYDYRPFKNSIFLNKIIGNSSKILGVLANIILPYWFICFPHKYNKEKSIPISICFTSFPKRINKVWLVIECLLRQSLQPEEVRLYLSKEQFKCLDELPKNLKKYINNYFLKVYLVENDIKSHKKYWYAINDNVNRPIILVDDDIIYSSDTIKLLWENSKLHTDCVIACYCHKIKWDNNTKLILPYSKWKGKVNIGDKGVDIFFGSGGGTYFPYNSLLNANESIDILSKICPLADDIWLNAIIRKNGFKVLNIKRKGAVPEWKRFNNYKLSTINNGESYNDKQLNNVISFFIEKYGFNPYSIN